MGIKGKIIFVIFVTALVTVFLAPVYNLNISTGDGKDLFSYPISSRQKITTGYIHSVQLTPVEDDYRILDNMVWLWEERVVSHNAGLPTEAPRNGSFFSDRDWMYVRGGRYHWNRVHFRVGNDELGRNWMQIKPFQRSQLYELYPGQLFKLHVDRNPLILNMFEGKTRKLF